MLQIRRYSTFSYAYCYYLFGRYLSMIGWKKIDDIFHKSTMMLNVIIEKVFYIICLNGPWYYNLVRIYFSNPHRLIMAKFWFLWGYPILWVIKKKLKKKKKKTKTTTTGWGAVISSINLGCSSKKSFLSLLLKLMMRWHVVDMVVTILHIWDFIFRLGFGGFPTFSLRLSYLAFLHLVSFLFVRLFISYEYRLNQLVSFSLFACLVNKSTGQIQIRSVEKCGRNWPVWLFGVICHGVWEVTLK